LNSKPLTAALGQLAPDAEIVMDLPSRLADGLAAGRLDVALIPSIEYFRHPSYTVVSDACIACDGPVKSVKLFSRVPFEKIRTLALDEGSRTSAALVQILLRERFGLSPRRECLPIGASLTDATTDAVLLIGDRAIALRESPFDFAWDLGQQWLAWTGLPFVFAMWVARDGIAPRTIEAIFTAARDQGLKRLEQIAEQEWKGAGIPFEECLAYLRDHLKFFLGDRERQALEKFLGLAVKHQLAPAGGSLVFDRESA
jgi:chorismate dehydratase